MVIADRNQTGTAMTAMNGISAELLKRALRCLVRAQIPPTELLDLCLLSDVRHQCPTVRAMALFDMLHDLVAGQLLAHRSAVFGTRCAQLNHSCAELKVDIARDFSTGSGSPSMALMAFTAVGLLLATLKFRKSLD